MTASWLPALVRIRFGPSDCHCLLTVFSLSDTELWEATACILLSVALGVCGRHSMNIYCFLLFPSVCLALTTSATIGSSKIPLVSLSRALSFIPFSHVLVSSFHSYNGVLDSGHELSLWNTWQKNQKSLVLLFPPSRLPQWQGELSM